MIVIDTSALIAILRLEPEADDFMRAIADNEACFVSALSLLEAAMVLTRLRDTAAVWKPLDALLTRLRITVEPLDLDQAYHARNAFVRFGKGRHPAALNLGDCVSYALAASKGLPLLFKGNDFAKTDLEVYKSH